MIKRAIRSNIRTDLLQRLWNALPEQRGELLPYFRQARAYKSECGCTMGGVFLMGALILLLLDILFFHVLSSGGWLSTGLEGTAFIFGASIVGKATGIVIARIRLAWMYRELRIRYRMEGE